MNANARLLLGCICLLAVSAKAGYFPIDSKPVYEYEEKTSSGGIGVYDSSTFMKIRRSFSPVISGSGDSYQRVTDSIVEIVSLTYLGKIDTLFKIKTYKINYSDTEIVFDSLFQTFSFAVGYPRLGKSIFSSPLPKANFTNADELQAHPCRFTLKGVSENCINIERGGSDQVNIRTDYSSIVFSENFGIKEAVYTISSRFQGFNRQLTLKRIISRADTIDFNNSQVVGVANKEKRGGYQDLNGLRKNRSVKVDLYSIQGKLLYSRKFGAGEAIELKGKPESAVEVIHFGSGAP